MKRVKLLIISFILILLTNRIYADATVLIFHRFNDNRYPTTSISNQEFINICQFLKDNHYQVVSLERIVNYIENKEEIPDKIVALTIDDGYQSFYYNGFKILKEYNYPFTLFVNTKAINQGYGDFLSWEELKEIGRYGSIGSHGYEHYHLTKLTLGQVEKDITQSIVDIKDNLGMRPIFFSYPYGEYNQEIKNKIKELEFKAAFNQTLGAIAKESELFSLNRIAVTDDLKIEDQLKYRYLEAKWLNEEEMVKDNRLIRIEVQVDQKIKKAELYITGYGWRKVELDDGLLKLDLDLELKNSRNRLFLKTYNNQLAAKMILIN